MAALGQTVEAGDAVSAVESVKSASDISSPVTGEVVEANEALSDTPGLVNKSPEGEGWIAKIKVDGAGALENDLLMDEEVCMTQESCFGDRQGFG